MQRKRTILIVEDNEMNRELLKNILLQYYDVVEAENGQQALELLKKNGKAISAIMLDLFMPVMDGFRFLDEIAKMERFKDIPVIVVTASNDSKNEKTALARGAWDYVYKPYDPEIVLFRLRNALDRSKLTAFKQLKYLAEYDSLTGIFNKNKFNETTREMMTRYPDRKFVFIRVDIDRFQLVNSYFGMEEGDKLLRYLGNTIRSWCETHLPSSYGRQQADVFSMVCACKDRSEVIAITNYLYQKIKQYRISIDLVPTFGIYEITEPDMPVNRMTDYADLASRKAKNSYEDSYAFYDPSMRMEIETEQEMINDMKPALEKEQFCIYIQPKYSLKTNMPIGGEALVRWKHSTKGLVMPSKFIPIFEKNGFITKLDYFVWMKTCEFLRNALDEGLSPKPISVNVSRVDIFNPRIVSMLTGLLEEYRLPSSLLELEVTESAYADNPQAMRTVVDDLRREGFRVLLDDFGSGYSSLSVLKDFNIDYIKIDTKFLTKTDIPGRGENIVASIVRMGKWIGIPMIAEGAERQEQVEFLKSIGCDYVQGFYFGRPMSTEQYHDLIKINKAFISLSKQTEVRDGELGNPFEQNPEMERLFSNAAQAAGVYLYDGDRIRALRVNNAYTELFGYEDPAITSNNALTALKPEYRHVLLGAVKRAYETKENAECEYLRKASASGAKMLWINTKINYIRNDEDRCIFMASFFDISAQKEIETELYKYQNTVREPEGRPVLLVVDDDAEERKKLASVFAEKFSVMEVSSGSEAFSLLENLRYKVDLIVVDNTMPGMSGEEFLTRKKMIADAAAIPSIILTDRELSEEETAVITTYASDFLSRPIDVMTARRRATYVLGSARRFRLMMKEYQTAVDLANTDYLTKLTNRAAAETRITDALKRYQGEKHAMIMVDIDDFKLVNDQYGHSYGDLVLVEFAKKLRQFFRRDDIVARMGGDEFCVFMIGVGSAEKVLEKCQDLCEIVSDMEIGDEKVKISCAAGIAITDENSVFEKIYKQSDDALYEAKHRGKNQAALFNG